MSVESRTAFKGSKTDSKDSSLRGSKAYALDEKEVERFGLPKVREVPGYHDEPLRGKRKGQRSIRFTKAYRAIYTENQSGEIHLVSIEEVSKHDY